MIYSNKSRKDKQEAARKAVLAQHTIWVLRIQELIAQKGKTAKQAYVILCDEVTKEEVRPQYRAQFDAAWREFQKKVEAAQN
jgi:wobble nucleotide-excising tRNase